MPTDGVIVEISVYKPEGYSIHYFVEGTENRFIAVQKAIEDFKNTEGETPLEFLNYISASLASKEAKYAKYRILHST